MLYCSTFTTYDKQIIRDYRWEGEDADYGDKLFQAVVNLPRVKCDYRVKTTRKNYEDDSEVTLSYELSCLIDGYQMILHIDCLARTAWACIEHNAVDLDVFLLSNA